MDRRRRRASGRGVVRAAGGLAVWLALTLLSALPTQADDMTPAVLAASCASCHGPGGASPGAIPSIDRLDAATMTALLNGFRSGQIEATVMNRIAKGYTDAEMAALVQYYAGLKR